MDKEKDKFSDSIKDKLSNYSLPVDDDSWNKIEASLASISRSKTRRVWLTKISAAASIALLIILIPIIKKVYNHESTNQLSSHEETIIQIVPEETIVKSDLQQDDEYSAIFRNPQSGKRLAENRLTDEVITQTQNQLIAEAITKNETREENHPVEAKEEVATQRNPPTYQVYDIYREKENIFPIIKKRKHQSINLSIGSGSNLLASNNSSLHKNAQADFNNDGPYFRAATKDTPDPRTEEILLNENYPNVVHYPPVSFGVTVKKDLNNTIALESGIVYSFTTTSFSRDLSLKSKAVLKLHYVGIPLNIHARLNKNRNALLGAYLSFGGMVEKGVLSHFEKKDYFSDINNTIRTVTSKEKIDGLQWSVGISPGIDYKIHKNYSIYLEPKLSYYFDNNQPESARTNHPLTVGVNAGVRYTW